MHIVIVILVCIVAVLLVVAVLLQNSKGGGLTGAFGSAGASQVLGVRRTADFLSKTTTVLAALFFVLCVVAEFTTNSSAENGSNESVIQRNAPKASPALPQVPGQPALPSAQPQPAPTDEKKPDEKK
jgi:preprotein translocase subunit SecG